MLGFSTPSLRTVSAAALGLAAALGAAAILAGLGAGTEERRADETRLALRSAATILSNGLDRTLYDVSRDVRLAAQNGLLIQAGPSSEAQHQFLVAWRNLRPEYAEILYAAPNGRVLATASGRAEGSDAGGSAWFGRGRAGTAIIDGSDAGRSGAGSGRLVQIAAPVTTESGVPRGVVAVQLDESWAREAEQLARTALGDAQRGVSFTVLSAAGQVLYRSGPEQAWTGSGAPALEGSASATGFRDFSGLGWMVVARVPAEAALAPGLFPGLGTPVLLPLLLGAIGLAAILGWLLAGPLVRCLRAAGRTCLGEDTTRTLVAPPVAEFRTLVARAIESADRHLIRDHALREAQSALRRSKERVQAFKTLAGWSCWEIDHTTRQVTWSDLTRTRVSDAAERAASLDEIIERIHPEDRAVLQLTMQAALDGSVPHDVTVRSREDGRERRLLMRFTRIIDQGRPTARLHALSREVDDALEGPVRAAPAHPLSPGEPDAAVERRRRDVMRRMTDGIIHDFNNALTVVLTSLSVLQHRHDVSPEGARLLDHALQGAERGAGLTRRMVALTRRQTSTLAQADLRMILSDLDGFLRISVLPEARLAVEIPAELPAAQCSERQIEIALLNLAFEARDTMAPEGRLTVSAAAAELPAPGGPALPPGPYLRVAVINHEPVPAASDAAGGAGIEAVDLLLRQVGGALRRATDAAGATVTELWLPASREAPQVPAPMPVPAFNRPLRVLLVDGDGLLRDSTAAAIADLGHVVTQAGSGLQAMELLAADRDYDVMIADYAMPILSGLQLAAVVSLTNPSLDIVLAAPRGHLPETARRFRQLDKPFRQADIARILVQHAPSARAA
ncbi:hybrid sensor histidine kinase/response regulator [Methylobacterium oryzihabitans]|uniref:histidine kinase n=1 Tax=Methylobacterium oryzihabitans TaxID=2499852 RepID=A0A3S2VDU5_9HYPH|nr:response regulator [Methylobacterium oryzihabitans]RVU20552.1 response regulator [Methylobacterium oryzihabitans]